MTGLFLHRSTDATALVDELATRLGGTRPDPFVIELVVTPHQHLRRWLTNELARRLGRPGEGVCAGVSFISPGRLLRELGDPGRFWHPHRLSWRLLEVLAANPEVPELTQLRRHLAGSRGGYPVARRIAGLFNRYLQWRPELVKQWEAGENFGPAGEPLGFDAWQPVLWRLAAESASPIAALDDFVAGIRTEPAALPLPAMVSLVQPDPLAPWWLRVLDALAEVRELHVSLRQVTANHWPAPTGPRAAARLTRYETRANQGLAHRADELLPAAASTPGTLGWLQSRLGGDAVAAPLPDGSVQLHGGHGLERQVEILRDAITAVLAADPTLQPRDIIVGCPNLAAAAPLVQAGFQLPAGVPGRHPANDFRVQLADRSSAEANPLVGVLIQVLTLIASRATAADLIDLCVRPAVAQRFGLDEASIERLAALASQAGVRWGLSTHHRARFGLNLPHNTWTAGLLRMLLGVALSESDLPTVGTVLPLDDVEDGDLLPLGGLTELVSRLAALASEADTPAPLGVWAQRLQRAVDDFTQVGGDEVWQRTDALLRLADLAERGAGDVPLSLAEVTDLVTDEFERGQARSAFGNGSLTFCSLGSLKGVPYRVVCLFGLDDGHFPRHADTDGDNLMLAQPQPGEPDPSAEDRQALADAVCSARQTLLIIHQSRSPQTNEQVPPSAALADLLDLLTEAGVHRVEHPLQPFSPRLFGADGDPVSFDPAGLRGAKAITVVRREPAAEPPVPPAPPLTEVALEDLIRFVNDPVRHFLRERCGLSFWAADPTSVEIPIELDGLERWSIGERALNLAAEDNDLARVLRAEWLRGGVPPGQLGTRLLDSLGQQVGPILDRLPVGPDIPVSHHDIAVDCGPVRVTGRVAARGDLVLQATFSKVSAKRTVGLWLQLVALSAAVEGAWRAMLVGRGGNQQFAAPPAAESKLLLNRLVRLYRVGMDAPLPLPLAFGASLFEVLNAGKDPFDEVRLLQRTYSDQYQKFGPDPVWAQFYPRAEDLLAVQQGHDNLDQPDEPLLAPAAARLIWQPISSHQVVAVR